MAGAYTALPKTEAEAAEYPPSSSSSPVTLNDRHKTLTTRATSLAHRLGKKYIIGGGVAVLLLLSLLLLPRRTHVYAADAAPGLFYRDPTPGATADRFWRLAEREIAARGLDTCGDMLGRGLVEGQAAARVDYCGANLDEDGTAPGAACFPLSRDGLLSFWPNPASPCVSRGLMPNGNGLEFHAQCPLTPAGGELKTAMGKETFLGSQLSQADADCKEHVGRTVLVIHRQDQWNPFHVAEDLITTVVTLFVAAAAMPRLAKERLQLVFTDDFGMDKNHYTALYDRMGAWAPRRLALDQWREGECLSTAIHSIGAGRSLLSAMGVGTSNQCASSITWAAAHYYRHLFGVNPTPPSGDINVLYLSRATFNAYAEAHGDWSAWRMYRRLENDAQLIARLRKGLAEMCENGDCVFDDDKSDPEAWTQRSGRHVRFAAIDPMVHALETQVHYAANAHVLVSQHGGGLGLALFLPPGQGAVVELQVNEVTGNFHFEHLAYQMGQRYELLHIERKVNVESVWGSVRQHVEELGK